MILSTMIAQVQTEAHKSPIITSLTTHPACQNRAQTETSVTGAASVRVSMCGSSLTILGDTLSLRRPKRFASRKNSGAYPPISAVQRLLRGKFGQRKAGRFLRILTILFMNAYG